MNNRTAPRRTGAPSHRAVTLAALVLPLLAACDPSPQPGGPPDLGSSVPVVGRHLDRSSPGNGGLLTGVSATGVPNREGPDVDIRVIEARRFYDTLTYPRAELQEVDYPNPFSGENEPRRKTAPLTFEAWKAAFGFAARAPDESLEAYRKRAGIVVYYNRNELGLGRELGCADFDDELGRDGQPGLACFVTNYGRAFGDQQGALALAVAGASPRNTVCITYRPSAEPDYQVQFYTYGADGKRSEWAQLDTLGPRPHPHVCMNCHGGYYDEGKHLARFARFLPLDPNVVVFEGGDGGAGPTRAAQEEPIRRINAAALRTPLAASQREMVQALYGGEPETAGTKSVPSWSPPSWQQSPGELDLWAQVLQPYCATCHLAIDRDRTGAEPLSHKLFASPVELRNYPLLPVLCATFGMPNAQPTMANFWDPSRGAVTIAGALFASPGDALLGAMGFDRQACTSLATMATCNRGPDPDALCGNASSGTACNRVTGRCVPDFGAQPISSPAGVCKMDGSRVCPGPLICEPMSSVPPGLESVDGICM